MRQKTNNAISKGQVLKQTKHLIKETYILQLRYKNFKKGAKINKSEI